MLLLAGRSRTRKVLDRTSAEIFAEGSEVLHEMRRAPPVGAVAKGEP